MFARMFTIEGRRDQLADFTRAGAEKVLPALRRLDGFEGLLVLTQRRSGKILVVTLWESEEAMCGGEEASYWFRAFGAEAAGGEVTNVERDEVVYSETEKQRGIGRNSGSSLFGRKVAAIAAEHGVQPSPPPRTASGLASMSRDTTGEEGTMLRAGEGSTNGHSGRTALPR